MHFRLRWSSRLQVRLEAWGNARILQKTLKVGGMAAGRFHDETWLRVALGCRPRAPRAIQRSSRGGRTRLFNHRHGRRTNLSPGRTSPRQEVGAVLIALMEPP